jgi:ubiquinone/menaquinone biosynthesis C-methylase UbiE
MTASSMTASSMTASSMRTTSRINYDAIAHLYDGQPYRNKTVDPELVTFVAHHASSDRLSLLDIACGTGSQLVANRPIIPDARLVGLGRSFGMLAQARSKGSDIACVQADGAELPFRARSFDFICCQFGFHHLPDKAGMLGEVLRVLRPGGRFAMRNLCPQESPDWLYYEYFPEAQTIDLEDFWPPDTIISTMETIGFVAVSAVPEHIRFEQDLRLWLDMVRRRDFNSQLMAISHRAYEDGIARLERQLADGGSAQVRTDHLCLLTIRGDK